MPAGKLIVIGFDGLSPEVLKRFTESGDCPRLAALRQRGSLAALLPAPPVDTATNWTTLATGTWTGTHGINAFQAHLPGESFAAHQDQAGSLSEWFRGQLHQLNHRARAEWLWQAAHRAGRKCLLVNYPAGWPPTDDWQVTVDGSGPCSSPLVRLTTAHLFATREAHAERTSNVLRTTAPGGWANPPDSGRSPLEVAFIVTGEVNLEPTSAGWIVAAAGGDPPKIDPSLMYCCLLVASGPGEGDSDPPYDAIVICRGRDAQHPVARLKVGEWSGWITQELKTPRGSATGRFKLQLRMLSPGGREVALYRTPILDAAGWAHPPEVAERLLETWLAGADDGLAQAVQAPPGTLTESLADEARGLAWTCRELSRDTDWDVLITQIHAPDNLLHEMLNELHPGSRHYRADKATGAWERLRREMALLDGFVGEVLDACGGDDVAVAVVSDHGSIPSEKCVWLGKWLINAGLSTYVTDSETGKMRLHWPDTKAVLGDHPLAQNVWVNLQGREPEGIVPPEDYEQVRTEIINALLSARDPENGVCPVAVALRREEARFLGQWGDHVGDVVYYLVPGYMNDIRVYSAGLVDPAHTPPEGVWECVGPLQGIHHCYLPGAELGGFSVQGVLLLSGPGVASGLERTTALRTVDVTPTLCYLLGIGPPTTAEGCVAKDLLE